MKNLQSSHPEVALSPRVLEYLAPLLPALQEFYAERGCRMTERELWVEIERRFGDTLARTFCIPLGLSEGAGVFIAALAARQAESLIPLRRSSSSRRLS